MIKIEKYKKYVYNVIFQEFTLFQVVIVIYKRWLETNKPKKNSYVMFFKFLPETSSLKAENLFIQRNEL